MMKMWTPRYWAEFERLRRDCHENCTASDALAWRRSVVCRGFDLHVHPSSWRMSWLVQRTFSFSTRLCSSGGWWKRWKVLRDSNSVLCQLLKARTVKSSTMDGAHAACVGGRPNAGAKVIWIGALRPANLKPYVGRVRYRIRVLCEDLDFLTLIDATEYHR